MQPVLVTEEQPMSSHTEKLSIWKLLYSWLIIKAYGLDVLAAIIAIIVNSVVPQAISPIQRFYATTDETLAYPYGDDTIPGYALVLLFLGVPILVFTIGALLQKSVVDWLHACLSLAEGYAVAVTFKRWLNLTGVYRPDWINYQLQATVSTNDGRRSYPSGHATYIFYAMTITSLYLFGKLRIYSQPSAALFVKFYVSLAPLFLAAFVAATRIVNYRHSPADVNAGCFIGILSGVSCYFLNYPSLFAKDCAQPHVREDCCGWSPAAKRSEASTSKSEVLSEA